MAQVIGSRFEMGVVLGQGGMGTVFQGVDLQTRQPVAIKLLRPEVVQGNPGLVARFEREGEALRRLNHPNIVKMLATVDQDNDHYIVMEYVSGSLENLLDEMTTQVAPLPIDQILQIALELADALSRAHHLKIIHRDIKPSNVLLADDGTPRLTDFGIARLDDHTRMTESGLVVGTFAYLSPEACAGVDLDARTDIWSFGVMLYEMLTGKRPFNEDSMAAIVTAILSKTPADVRTLRPDTPPALADLIHRMLEKDRDERISSMRQLGAELEAISQGKTTPTPRRFITPTPTPTLGVDQPATLTQPASVESTRRRTVGLAVGGISILVLAVILFINLNSGCCPSTPALTLTPVPALTDEGEYIVLVASFEPVRTEIRDVGRLIADDLKQYLEMEAPYSKLTIEPYATVITSDDEALEAAEATGATVVIWGNYTADTVTANVHLGVLSAFKYNQFDRDLLERTANVRVQLTDETSQSLAPNVLAALGVMYTADGDLYGIARTWITLDGLQTLHVAELTGDSTVVRVHRFYQTFNSDPAQAVENINQAINSDAGNALLYAFHSHAFYREATAGQTGQFRFVNDAQKLRLNTNAESAEKLGPADWALAPLLFYSADATVILTIINRAIELRPDDWYLYYARSDTQVRSSSDLEGIRQANADIETAASLQPDIQIPQALIIYTKVREGQIAGTVAYLDQFLTDVPPDTFFTNRLLEASWGFGYLQLGRIYAPFSKLMLGQYQQALEILSEAASAGTAYVPGASIFMTGIAQCSLGNDDAAQTAFAYDQTMITKLFSAEIALKQNNRKEALKQLAIVQRNDQGDLLAPFATAVLNGEFGCKDLFNSTKIRQIEDKYGSLTATDFGVTLT
ncbi:MAG: protein kinase, partial [Anaerolineae bacterium]|nr:protein kinase [Anaerolineae bacterium]